MLHTSPFSPSFRAGALLLLVIMLLGWAGTASADQNWTYSVRPGDTLWDLSAKHLKDNIPWQNLQNHNHVSNPLHLTPGMKLQFPISWLRIQPAKAEILALRGPVMAQTGVSAPAVPASEGMKLGIGNQLETGANASATLGFADGSRLLVQENSVVVFDQLSTYGTTGMVDTRMRLQRGRATNQVVPARGPGSRYIIRTPSATTSVRGTRFRVSAGDDTGAAGTTEVLDGKVRVDNPYGAVLLNPGYGTVYGNDDAPSAPDELLPAPSLEDAGTHLQRLPLELAWAAQAGAQGYRVEIVRDDAPEVLLFGANTKGLQMRITELPAGRHRLRLRAISANGMEGYDAERRFEISDTPEPPLTIHPRYDERLHDPRPRFEWARSEGASSTIIQVATDPEFRQRIVDRNTQGLHLRGDADLAPGNYYWRLASRDANGHSGPFGQSLPFEISDEPVPLNMESPQTQSNKLTLRWQAGRPGQRYRVQISRRGTFDKLLLDQEVDTPQITLKKPRPGNWYIRVQTIDDDGYASPFGPHQQVRLPCRICYGAATGAVVLLLVL